MIPGPAQFIAAIRDNRHCDLTVSDVLHLVALIQLGDVIAAPAHWPETDVRARIASLTANLPGACQIADARREVGL